MAFKFVAFFALVASSSAVIIKTHQQPYSDAPSVSYSSISSPPSAHGSPSYAAPAYKISAPLAYNAPTYKVAAPVAYAAPLAKAVYAEPSEPAHYNFEYVIEDPHTGDSKSQQETREGDITKGSYSLIEADGTKRIVEYTVDGHSGFNAVVHKEPAQGYSKVAAPVAYAAPVAKIAASADAAPSYAIPAFKVAAPLAYSAKVPAFAKTTYSNAPEVSYSSISSPVAHDAPSYYH